MSVLGLAAELELDLELVVHLGHRVRGELDVDDRADDAGDAADAARSRVGPLVSSTVAVMSLTHSRRWRRPAR